MKSHRIIWRWAERDLGFRLRTGAGKRSVDHYQTIRPGEFYVVQPNQRKLTQERIEDLSSVATAPTAPTIVASPWREYGQDDWQLIQSQDGICLNWAGCLSRAEIHRRETDGVNRAREFVIEFANRRPHASITLDTIQRLHTEMFGEIYSWAGQWRTVTINKSGITWDVPFHDMGITMKNFEAHTLNRTPFLSEEPEEALMLAARVLGEYIAIHPFREGNGRSAFLLSEIILLQNGLLPFDRHQRGRDQARYYAACEAARVRFDYNLLAQLFIEWQGEAQEAFEQEGGAPA